MSDAKTLPTGVSVEEYIAQVTPAGRQNDARILDALFQEVTGWKPQMWGPTIIGYGTYRYTYKSGRTGVCQATGFAPRKAKMVLYIMPGYANFGSILERIGPHKMGQSCLYLGALSKIDLDVLRELVTAGLEDLETRWPIEPS